MAAGLLSFGIHLVLCSVSMPGVMYIKSISWERLFFFCLWQFLRLACYFTLALSDCPQGIQALSLP